MLAPRAAGGGCTWELGPLCCRRCPGPRAPGTTGAGTRWESQGLQHWGGWIGFAPRAERDGARGLGLGQGSRRDVLPAPRLGEPGRDWGQPHPPGSGSAMLLREGMPWEPPTPPAPLSSPWWWRSLQTSAGCRAGGKLFRRSSARSTCSVGRGSSHPAPSSLSPWDTLAAPWGGGLPPPLPMDTGPPPSPSQGWGPPVSPASPFLWTPGSSRAPPALPVPPGWGS